MPDGGLGIGSVVVGWLGSAVTAGGFAAGAIAGAIDMAIIGAAVGGLTSAVTGGDILQGVLVGAVGGAVTGGIMGGINPASFGVGGTTGMDAGVVSVGAEGLKHITPSMTKQAITAGTQVVDETTGSLVGAAGQLGKGALTSSLGEMVASGVVEGVKGMAAADAQESAMEMQREEARLQREHELKKLEMQLAAGSGGGGAQKSQQLSSTIAKIEADRNLQREAWQREDTAAARRAATAKSIGRAGVLNRPTLSERDVQVLTADAKGIEPLELTDPTEAALAAQRAV